jgi:hypothetical protein
VPSLVPDRIVVLTPGPTASILPCSPEHAARVLTTSTYTAGELRRYWTFAAMLAIGTGLGPSHPDVAGVSEKLATSLPCFEVVVDDPARASLSELTSGVERSWI